MAAAERVVEVPVRVRLLLDGVPEVSEVRRLVLRPGDRLVVKLDHCLDDAGFDRLIRDVRDALGDDVRALILEPGMDLEVLSVEPGGS